MTARPLPHDPLSVASILRDYRRIIAALVAVPLLLVALAGAAGILWLVVERHPQLRYVDTLVQYVATPEGQAPVEWIVRLQVGGERVEARCLSEGEAIRLKKATE